MERSLVDSEPPTEPLGRSLPGPIEQASIG